MSIFLITNFPNQCVSFKSHFLLFIALQCSVICLDVFLIGKLFNITWMLFNLWKLCVWHIKLLQVCISRDSPSFLKPSSNENKTIYSATMASSSGRSDTRCTASIFECLWLRQAINDYTASTIWICTKDTFIWVALFRYRLLSPCLD